MSLKIIIGKAASGKTDMLLKELTVRADRNKDELFYILSPEQASFMMQAEVVRHHPKSATMNIDVVSFNRLAQVVFTEVGVSIAGILDDTGKTLMLRKVIDDLKNDLKVYGNKIRMPGFIEEAKSQITELKQYDIDDNALFLMGEATEKKGNRLLCEKINDIRLIYEKFNEEIKDKYTTSEEVLDVFARIIPQSERLRGAHIYLDGYTGFTPIQLKVLEKMLLHCADVNLTLTLPKDKVDANCPEYEMFHLSNKTYFKLLEIAEKTGAETEIVSTGVLNQNISGKMGDGKTETSPIETGKSGHSGSEPVEGNSGASAGEKVPGDFWNRGEESSTGEDADGETVGAKVLDDSGNQDNMPGEKAPGDFWNRGEESSTGVDANGETVGAKAPDDSGNQDNMPGEKAGAALAGAGFPRTVARFSEKAGMASVESAKGRQAFIYAGETPAAEVVFAAKEIRRLVRHENYRYRDIAVIASDMETYYPVIRDIFAEAEIPAFIDYKAELSENPASRFVKAALNLLCAPYAQEALFAYLKTGLCGLSYEETGLIENYCLEFGARGFSGFAREFNKNRKAGNGYFWDLDTINRIRNKVVKSFGGFYYRLAGGMQAAGQAALSGEVRAVGTAATGGTQAAGQAAVSGKVQVAGQAALSGEAQAAGTAAVSGEAQAAARYCECLKQLLKDNRIQEQLEEMSAGFENSGELALSREYSRIYEMILGLIEKTERLIGNEKLAPREYFDIIMDGLAEIKVGIIPPALDNLIVGDLTRTRCSNAKAIFMLGVNEGQVPKTSKKPGLLTQKEREILKDGNFSLAPGTLENLYAQHFYLHMLFSKPEERLYLTYAMGTGAGESAEPSVVLDNLDNYVPDISPEIITKVPEETWKQQSLREAAETMRKFVAKKIYGNEDEKPDESVLRYFAENEPELLKPVFDGGFYTNRETAIDKELAQRLYGKMLSGSVSRFEKYSECAYKHFLGYGLRLEKRPEYKIEATDIGTLYHDSLERYSEKLKENKLTFRDVSDGESHRLAEESVAESLKNADSDCFQDTARNRFLLKRITDVTLKTTDVLREHVKAGAFEPAEFEYEFKSGISDHIEFKGKIDRVDIYDAGDAYYVKIIDYKSGNKEFSFKDIFLGLQLQLVAYLSEEVKAKRKKYPDRNVKPGGVYYYLINDKFTSDESEADKKYRMSGLTLADRKVIEGVDSAFAGGAAESRIVSVKYDSKGNLKSAGAGDDRQFENMMAFVDGKIRQIGDEIYGGNIETRPLLESSGKSACTYCDFKDICKFEDGNFGNAFRTVPDLKPDEARAAVLDGEMPAVPEADGRAVGSSGPGTENMSGPGDTKTAPEGESKAGSSGTGINPALADGKEAGSSGTGTENMFGSGTKTAPEGESKAGSSGTGTNPALADGREDGSSGTGTNPVLADGKEAGSSEAGTEHMAGSAGTKTAPEGESKAGSSGTGTNPALADGKEAGLSGYTGTETALAGGSGEHNA